MIPEVQLQKEFDDLQRKLRRIRRSNQQYMIANIQGPAFTVSSATYKKLAANSNPVRIYPKYSTATINRVVMKNLHEAGILAPK